MSSGIKFKSPLLNNDRDLFTGKCQYEEAAFQDVSKPIQEVFTEKRKEP